MRWTALCLLLIGASASAGTATEVTGSLSSGILVDTYYVFPDHQSLARLEDAAEGVASPWGTLGANSDLITMGNRVCDLRDAHNIKAAIGMGDMVNDGQDVNEWVPFDSFVSVLDACRVPYAAALGNHEFSGGEPDPGLNAYDATLYHQHQGQDVMDVKGWFAGSRAERPRWVYLKANGTPMYLENTTTYKSRSFWVPIPPFNFIFPEWEWGIRISEADWPRQDYGPADGWIYQMKAQYPHDYWFLVTHAGPCDTPDNCDLTPEDNHPVNPKGGDWAPVIESMGKNIIGYLNGHWGRGGVRGCWGGSGTYNTQIRDDGSRWIAGGFDFNCGTRLDPQISASNTNVCPTNGFGPPGTCPGADCIDCDSNPYTWSGWVTLERSGGPAICLNTVRTIDVDSDNDGVPNSVPPNATAVLEFDRGTTYGHPDPTETNTNCGGDDLGGFSGPDELQGCPNRPRTCMVVTPL